MFVSWLGGWVCLIPSHSHKICHIPQKTLHLPKRIWNIYYCSLLYPHSRCIHLPLEFSFILWITIGSKKVSLKILILFYTEFLHVCTQREHTRKFWDSLATTWNHPEDGVNHLYHDAPLVITFIGRILVSFGPFSKIKLHISTHHQLSNWWGWNCDVSIFIGVVCRTYSVDYFPCFIDALLRMAVSLLISDRFWKKTAYIYTVRAHKLRWQGGQLTDGGV